MFGYNVINPNLSHYFVKYKISFFQSNADTIYFAHKLLFLREKFVKGWGVDIGNTVSKYRVVFGLWINLSFLPEVTLFYFVVRVEIT